MKIEVVSGFFYAFSVMLELMVLWKANQNEEQRFEKKPLKILLEDLLGIPWLAQLHDFDVHTCHSMW